MSPAPFLPTRPPKVNHATRPFWEACAEGRLVVPRCDDCGELIWYPRLFCPSCASTSVTWTDMSGRGTVYSFSITRKGAGPFRDVAPYVLAYVELDEGPIMLTNVVGCDPDAVEIGMVVEVVFEPAGEGLDGHPTAIPRFTPRS